MSTSPRADKAGFTLDSNKSYWEDPQTVSIIDANLRELEIEFVLRHLRREHRMADVGCGDGVSTVRYAQAVRNCVGVERSHQQLSKARAARDHAGVKNLEFAEGDVLDLSKVPGAPFDVIVTNRVIINLPSWELQKKALDAIRANLRPGGLYVCTENTFDADDAMNGFREKVGLPPIPTHWHNLFMDYEKLVAHLDGRMELVERRGFNLYYFLTRVYTQMFASFTGSGRGAKADPIFAHSDKAARQLEHLLGPQVRFDGHPVVGPIQGLAFRKVGP